VARTWGEPSVRWAAMSDSPVEIPERLSYRLKRIFLGPPLVTEKLQSERLRNSVALGVLSPDCISSSAYGSEEMLREMVPYVGLAAFSLLLPITVAILVVLVLVTLSYREVVMVYTRAGGSYVVARDNFGSNVAQIAAVALLIDYTVTVAVQTAAGTDALTSAVPSLVRYTVPITVAVVVVLVYGNLRGIREAGKAFALPTFFFIFAILAVIVTGIVRAVSGTLPKLPANRPGLVQLGHPGSGVLMGLGLFYLLRAFANGGSSLTGLEAISNGVSAFRPPEGLNARRTLVFMSATLGTLVLGVSLLARLTHALPYASGTPTVISQEAKVVFGSHGVGTVLYFIVQLATLLILYTGANTSFNGFPFLASFVAEDSFLPRQLTRRGHRLAFSNGIIVLAVVSIALLIVTRAQVNSLVAIYAIGVFTGFTMAGAGMVKHHLDRRHGRFRLKILINGSSAVLSGLVVLIFAVTKFTQGAYVVVLLGPLMVLGLIRLNRQYRREAAVLGEGVAASAAESPTLPRHNALVLVDRLDLATARAIQYARALNPDELRAVHFVLDSVRAERLAERWVRLGLSRVALELIECPDRRLARAAMEMAAEAGADGQTEVSVLLPRRAYSRAWSRFLHDQTADRIVVAVSQLQHVTATIVPFEVGRALARLDSSPSDVSPPAPDAERSTARLPAEHWREREEDPVLAASTPEGAHPIAEVTERSVTKVVGRIRSVRVQPWGGIPSVQVTLADSTGRINVTFLGRRQIPGIEPGARLVVEGTVSVHHGQQTILNPMYELIAPVEVD
jgi:amino acid transporter